MIIQDVASMIILAKGLTYPFNSGACELIRSRHDGRHHGASESQPVDMEGTSVAVHEQHGSREVEQTSCQDAEAGPGVEGVAG